MNGIVKEASYKISNVPVDRNNNGKLFLCDMDISLENRQRAKILSSPVQILECQAIIHAKKLNHYLKQKAAYEKESNVYNFNDLCERKLVKLLMNKPNNDQDTIADNNWAY